LGPQDCGKPQLGGQVDEGGGPARPLASGSNAPVSTFLSTRSNVELKCHRRLRTEARRIYVHDHAVHITSKQLPERAIDHNVIKANVKKADHYLRTSQYGMDSPKLWESVGARFADDVVPKMLYDELVRELDALATLGPKDLHPGSEGKVHDVIHPSLCMYNITSCLCTAE
jgi:hypothetical protein